MTKGWLITGSSRGFGRIWAEAALRRGDRVVLTARDVSAVADLVAQFPDTATAIALDVTDKQTVDAALPAAAEFLGSLDVVVNNAGYGLFGMLEEIPEDAARAQIETNVLGALWVTQAALPIMRAQGHGHIVQVSSIGGVQAFPGIGLYHASKWALEGFSQSLASEVEPFGIKVTLIEPTGYNTDWATTSSVRVEGLAAYDSIRDAATAARAKVAADRGDPLATVDALMAIVDMDQPPLRLFVGKGAHETIHAEYAKRLAEWDAYEALSTAAHKLPD